MTESELVEIEERQRKASAEPSGGHTSTIVRVDVHRLVAEVRRLRTALADQSDSGEE